MENEVLWQQKSIFTWHHITRADNVIGGNTTSQCKRPATLWYSLMRVCSILIKWFAFVIVSFLLFWTVCSLRMFLFVVFYYYMFCQWMPMYLSTAQSSRLWSRVSCCLWQHVLILVKLTFNKENLVRSHHYKKGISYMQGAQHLHSGRIHFKLVYVDKKYTIMSCCNVDTNPCRHVPA